MYWYPAAVNDIYIYSLLYTLYFTDEDGSGKYLVDFQQKTIDSVRQKMEEKRKKEIMERKQKEEEERKEEEKLLQEKIADPDNPEEDW